MSSSTTIDTDRIVSAIQELKDAIIDNGKVSGKSGAVSSRTRAFVEDTNQSLEERLEKLQKIHDLQNASRNQQKRYYEEEAKSIQAELDRLEKERKAYERRIKALKKMGAAATENEKNELENLQSKKADNENKTVAKTKELLDAQDRVNSRSLSTLEIAGKIKDTVVGIYKGIRAFNEPWAQADEAASRFAKSIGVASEGMKELRKNAIGAVSELKLGVKYNINAEELTKLQQSYLRQVGRSNIGISKSQMEEMAAMQAVMGEEGAIQQMAAYEKFGLSVSEAAKTAGKMFSDASKHGINFSKYSENVRNNIAIAQNYTFKDGLKGLESMAMKATAIKMDMQQVAAFASKVNTVEGAINVGARLQVLGGSFAQIADPMGMLNESLTDMEGLQDRMASMVRGLGTFNKATGEINLSAFDKARIRSAAEAMGIDSNKLIESSQAIARREEIGKQIRSAGVTFGGDKDLMELVKNTGTFKDGKAGVVINGQFKELKDIKGESDKQALIAQSRTDSQNIAQIAQDLRSLKDIRAGAEKQLKNVQAQISESTGLGEAAKSLTNTVGTTNALLYTLIGITALSNIGGFTKRTVEGFGGKMPALGRKGGFFRNAKAARIKTGRKATQIIRNVGGKTSNFASNLGTKVGSGFSKIGTTASKLMGSMGSRAGAAVGGAVLGGLISGFQTWKEEFKGDNNHSKATKVRRTAGSAIGGAAGGAIGAAIGSAILPGIGTIIGGALGSMAGSGIGKAIGSRRHNAMEKLGLVDSMKGDYSVKKIKAINRARYTGDISDKLINELYDKGDAELANEILKARENKQKKNIERREEEQKRFGVAKIKVGTAVINCNTVKINGGKPENGRGTSWEPIRETEEENKSLYGNNREHDRANRDFNVNINGTLKLTGDNGQSVDIINELRKNPNMLRSLADMISKELDIIDRGNYVPSKNGR